MVDFKIGDCIHARYRVFGIERGSVGLVYLCRDEALDMPVALKTFAFSSYEDWERFLPAFIHEAKTWINIGKQHNVVQAYSVMNLETDFGSYPFLAVELVESDPDSGAALSGWVPRLIGDLELILLIAYEICSGMIQIQKALGTNTVHRDLTPQNILVSREGAVKITDFGLTRAFDGDASDLFPLSLAPPNGLEFGPTVCGWGTPPYMAPEQIAGKTIDQRGDIYSFGCVLYEICTGHHIFDASTGQEFLQKHIVAPHVPVRVRNPSIPDDISEIIDVCLAKSPMNRPDNFEIVRNWIDGIIEERGAGKLWFHLCGFSSFTDRPRVRQDLGLSREGEIVLLSEVFGPDHVLKEGLAESLKEIDDCVRKERDYSLSRENRKEQRDLDAAREEMLCGDSFYRLAESTAEDPDKAEEILELALSRYKEAEILHVEEGRTAFRLGMAHSALAKLLKEKSPEQYEEHLRRARFEFVSAYASPKTKPHVDTIGETFYLQPYAAQYHYAATFLISDQLTKALSQFARLLDDLTSGPTPVRERVLVEQMTANVLNAIDLLTSEIRGQSKPLS